MTQYVYTDYDGCFYITAGKHYEVVSGSFEGSLFGIVDDEGYNILSSVVSAHLHEHPWQLVENTKETPTVKQMVANYYATAGIVPDPDLAASFIIGGPAGDGEYEEWVDEYSERFRSGYEAYFSADELKELSDLVYVIYGYALSRGWDLDEAIRRVDKNNLERMYQDDGTIKRDENGKIIKNPNTPKVDLRDLV